MTTATLDLLVRHTLFRGLEAGLVRRIARLGEPCRLEAGTVLFRLGDMGDALYGVLSGSVRISLTTSAGVMLEIAIMRPGDLFGEISLIDGLPRTADATALEACELVRIPREPFVRMMDHEPTLVRHLMDLLCTRVRASTEHLTARREAEYEAQQAKRMAEQTLDALRRTQKSLIQAEKMASLGGLVAGVAHEINTPLGIGLTTASHMADLTAALAGRFETASLRKSDLKSFLERLHDMQELLVSSLNRAGELVQSFKQIAVDQTSTERRRFDLRCYIDELMVGLRPCMHQAAVTVTINGPAALELEGYPGALSQVLSHLLKNALLHAFDPETGGTVSIVIAQPVADMVELRVADNGKGIPADIRDRIFDPFFTTRRGAGSSGLGLHIVYNIVLSTLRGTIAVESGSDRGTVFILRFPRIVPEERHPAFVPDAVPE